MYLMTDTKAVTSTYKIGTLHTQRSGHLSFFLEIKFFFLSLSCDRTHGDGRRQSRSLSSAALRTQKGTGSYPVYARYLLENELFVG